MADEQDEPADDAQPPEPPADLAKLAEVGESDLDAAERWWKGHCPEGAEGLVEGKAAEPASE